MAKPTIVRRLVKGTHLTFTELDANFQNLQDATVSLRAGSAGVTVNSDLNGTITLVAGSNITLTGDNTAKTISIAATGGSSFYNNGNIDPTSGFKPNAANGLVQKATLTADGYINEFQGATAGDRIILLLTMASTLYTNVSLTTTMKCLAGQPSLALGYFEEPSYSASSDKAWTFPNGTLVMMDMVYDGTNFWNRVEIYN
jgi:hypothetical protein